MMGAVGSGLPWQAGVFLRPALGRNGMRAALILVLGFAGAAWAASGSAQTTAGTSATIVVPVVAQTRCDHFDQWRRHPVLQPAARHCELAMHERSQREGEFRRRRFEA